jgi:hypothetical protein
MVDAPGLSTKGRARSGRSLDAIAPASSTVGPDFAGGDPPADAVAGSSALRAIATGTRKSRFTSPASVRADVPRLVRDLSAETNEIDARRGRIRAAAGKRLSFRRASELCSEPHAQSSNYHGQQCAVTVHA